MGGILGVRAQDTPQDIAKKELPKKDSNSLPPKPAIEGILRDDRKKVEAKDTVRN